MRLARFGRDGRRPAAEVVGQRHSLSEMTFTAALANALMLIAYVALTPAALAWNRHG
jgi:hypothetical protein